MSSPHYPRSTATTGAASEGVILLCIARTATVPDAVRIEQVLVRLCAEDRIEVFDGVLIDLPSDCAEPVYRPLQNLPRLAAVPAEVWARVIDDLIDTTRPRAQPLLPDLDISLEPGTGAIIAFCTTATPEQVAAYLTTARATVVTSPITTADYTRLRQHR
jgi:hypothetical protein